MFESSTAFSDPRDYLEATLQVADAADEDVSTFLYVEVKGAQHPRRGAFKLHTVPGQLWRYSSLLDDQGSWLVLAWLE